MTLSQLDEFAKKASESKVPPEVSMTELQMILGSSLTRAYIHGCLRGYLGAHEEMASDNTPVTDRSKN